MTVDTDSIDPVRGFFDECVFGFIYHDIQAAIDGNANYLAALGLVAYTEFIGGLINGTLGDSGKRKKRFYTFWNRMDRSTSPVRYTVTSSLRLSNKTECG